MPDFLRALIFVSGLATFAFAVAYKPFALKWGSSRIRVWIAIWMATTACLFFARGFWLSLFFTAGILVLSTRREKDRVVLYLLCFLLAPTAASTIPGIGSINSFFLVGYQSFLSIALLLPIVLSSSIGNGRYAKVPTNILLAYFALATVLLIRDTTVTNALRLTIEWALAFAVPYFAIVRSTNSQEKMGLALSAIVFAALPLAAIGIYELARNWHLFGPAFATWTKGDYILREGLLRASGPGLMSIPFGFIFMVAIGLCFGLPARMLSLKARVAIVALLLCGLLSPLARGPWLGMLVTCLAFLATGRRPVLNVLKLAFALAGALFVVGFTSFGERVIALIPYFGSEANTETADYREKLLSNAWTVIMRNPVFGSGDYLSAPEMQEMIQGQGIIDVVNTYLQVALGTGLAGLSLFVLFFVTVMAGLARIMLRLPESDQDAKNAARAIFATLAGTMVTIFTVSSVGHIPFLYWILGGLGAAQICIIRAQSDGVERRRLSASATRKPSLLLKPAARPKPGLKPSAN